MELQPLDPAWVLLEKNWCLGGLILASAIDRNSYINNVLT